MHDRLVFNLYMLRARAHAKGFRRGSPAEKVAGMAVSAKAQDGGSTVPSSAEIARKADAMLFAPIQALLDGFQPAALMGINGAGSVANAASSASSSACPSSAASLAAAEEEDADRVLNLWGRQIELERSGLEEARARYEASMVAAVAGGAGADHAPAASLMAHMFSGAVSALKAEQVAIAGGEAGMDRASMGPKLLLVDAETLAVIGLHTVLKNVLVPGPAAPGGSGPGNTAAKGVAAAGGYGSYGSYKKGGSGVEAAAGAEAGGAAAAAGGEAAATPPAAGARPFKGGRAPPPRHVAAAEPRLEARFTQVAMAVGRTVQAQVALERLREAVRREKAVRGALASAFRDSPFAADEAAATADGGGGPVPPLSLEEEAALLARFRKLTDEKGWGPPRLEALPSTAAVVAEEEERAVAGEGEGEDTQAATPPPRRPGGRKPRPPPELPSPASDLGKRLARLEKELAARDRANGSPIPRQAVAVRALRDLRAARDWDPKDCVKVGALVLRALVEGCRIPVPAGDADAMAAAVAAAGGEFTPAVGGAEGGSGGEGSCSPPPPAPEPSLPPFYRPSARPVVLDPPADASATATAVHVPAFAHYERRWRGRRVGVIRAHDEIGRRAMGRSGLLAAAATPDYKPMVVPPLPWRSCSEGGHLVLRSLVVRPPKQPGASMELKAALRAADARPPVGLSRVYAALNALGAVGWRINAPTLAAVEAVWAGGGGVAGLPPRTDLPPAARPPRFYARRPPGRVGEPKPCLVASGELPVERRFRVASNRHATKVNRERHSLRCDVELKLAVARQFAPERAFFYPHNLDFRGRAYPMHPHLHHLGSDLCRGLLEFAQPRPLGPDGYDWLLVQVANAYGHGQDKLSFEGRRAFAEEHLAEIHASAADPAGCAWWAGGEDPWQLLQTCGEVRAADATGDPASFLSRVPVRIDGSCNGLQHYAALGRDADGGAAVNLVPGTAPRDVYQGVADVVARRVARDAAKGVPAALLLEGEVDRKLVKQTVMTSVYGVTFVGARGQVMDRLRERGFVAAHGGQNSRAVFDAANYAARVTFDGLKELFGGARAIQGWLASVAAAVAASGAPVGWTTPLGLPVIQPYRRARDHHVRTVMQRLILASSDPASPVAVNRQRAAFPPNFIHALDSTHMMQTASAAAQAGLVFAGVHDSFWTHAGSVGALSGILRDQFVALHSRPLLADLAAELAAAHPGVALPPLPGTGDLDLEQVRASPYFFS